jgi:hypothetical protein
VRIVAVDLAAKYSAACAMTLGGVLLNQFDSWGKARNEFLAIITAPWRYATTPAALIVEDLPHGVRYMTVTKAVCRLQGRIIERMDSYGSADAIVFVQPETWRRSFPGLERGTGPGAVVGVAAGLGYDPPDLSSRVVKSGDKATARKVATDYCAAFLIARWAVTTYAAHGTFDVAGTSRQEAVRAEKH